MEPCAACPQPEKGRCADCTEPPANAPVKTLKLVPKGTRAPPTDEVVEREFRSLLARSGKYQPEYLDIILTASRFGFRYLDVKAVIEFLQWGCS